MKIITLQEILLKAKQKKDGVYSHKYHKYSVKNGNVKFYSEGTRIYQILGSFVTCIGKVEYLSDIRNKLLSLNKES